MTAAGSGMWAEGLPGLPRSLSLGGGLLLTGGSVPGRMSRIRSARSYGPCSPLQDGK